MRIDARKFRGSRYTSVQFDRWFNGGRKIKMPPDKLSTIRQKWVKFEYVLHKCALYGPNRGG
jgi:hypothetical protein